MYILFTLILFTVIGILFALARGSAEGERKGDVLCWALVGFVTGIISLLIVAT